MKKIEAIIALLIFLSTGFTSCIGEGDFDADKISLNELHPTFLLPLIQDTLTLNRQPNISHDGDTSIIFYNIDNIQLPSKDGWFSVSDVNENLVVPYSSVAGEVDRTLPPLSFSLLSDNSQKLDSLLCSGLPVRIAFSGLPLSLSLVEITFPQILVSGQPYTANVTTATEVTIPACKIVPKDKKQLEILVRIKGHVPASFNANLNVQIQNIQNYYTDLFGYFGQRTVAVKDSIVLDIMDDLNITADALEFSVLKIVTNIQNSMGIPFRLTLVDAKAYDQNGQLRATAPLNKSVDILAPGYTDINRIAITNKTIRCDGFGQILNKETKKIVFSFTCISNPNGNERNFLTATDTIQPALSIRIPLFVKAHKLVLQDTIGINMSSVSLEELKLQLHFKNSLPAEAKFNIWLLNEDNTRYSTPLINTLTIERPTIDNNGITVDETALQDSVTISKDLFSQLKESTRAIAVINIDTGTDYVKFMQKNNLYMKVGVAAKFKYEDLLK
ncbi:MAG: hypothetical protein LBB31_01455 [Prevotellaceae bacterium]|jgi:hypothetical protein|nr:hypothetical protein [Prevotellaceae bacterium]